jgi:hypothetical protein
LLGALRRLWHAHIAKQDEIISGLRGLRTDAAETHDRLARIEQVITALANTQGSQFRDLGEVVRSSAAAIQAASAQSDPALLARLEPLGQLSLITHEALVAALVAADGRNADPASLPRHHAQVYSQDGADGIIAEIFRRIGPRDRIFVEIGIENGTQNNTRFLLEQGWRGVWIEGDAGNVAEASRRFAGYIADGRLKIVARMVEPDDVQSVLADAGVPEAFDLLSLDVDQHTTHVWRAMRCCPRVACVEYNASVPPTVAVEVPYVRGAAWDGSNWFGGGLKTLERLGTQHGMHLVGCDPLGVNAFFVAASETDGRFRAPFTAEAHYQPPRHQAFSHLGHPPAPEERRWDAAP